MILVRAETLVYPATGVNVLFEDYSDGIAEMKAQVEANNITWDAVDIEVIASSPARWRRWRDTGGVGTGAAGAGDGGTRGDSSGAGNGARAPDNQVEATFMVSHYVGDFVRYYDELADGTEVTVKVLNDVAAPNPERGERSLLTWHSAECFAFQPR